MFCKGRNLAAIITYFITSSCILNVRSAATMKAVLYEEGGVENLKIGVVAKPSAGEKKVRLLNRRIKSTGKLVLSV